MPEPAANVSIDYAQVLKVEPVYEILRAARTEQQCDQDSAEPDVASAQAATPQQKEEGAFSRMMGAIRGLFSSRNDSVIVVTRAVPSSQVNPEQSAGERRNCRLVQVQREFQRPVAYDVDYIYAGTQYRSRLGDDPGNRVRIRVSITPDYPDTLPAH
ncbi:MAG: hypothetical protein LBL59_00985 [Xanthomonadaceae bacterium]|jgi:uncharacterized protein YcfJ|nr:hypothetical protein [Xanthomonadaceae bacterium]